MSNESAYRTSAPSALAAWHEWQTEGLAVMEKRRELTADLGRNAYINRGAGYGSNRIVGFERLDTDKDGDLLRDGDLIVSSKRGQHNGIVVPNIKRKSGKAFAEWLVQYTTPSLDLPGMATFHSYFHDGNMYVGGPSLFEWEGVLYAFWNCADAPHEEMWEEIPLSTYHLAKEQRDADAAAKKENQS